MRREGLIVVAKITFYFPEDDDPIFSGIDDPAEQFQPT